MIQTFLCSPSVGTLSEGGEELIAEWADSSDALIWVILQGEAEEDEARLLKERFSVHKLAVSDVQRTRHPPKLEEFSDNTLVMIKGLDASSSSLDFQTIQISLVVGERFLITRVSERSVSTEKMIEAVRSGKVRPDISRVELALRLVRTVGDRFLGILLDSEDRIEEMEVQMLRAPNDELLAELVRLKSDLKQMVRILSYHASVFAEAQAKPGSRLSEHEHLLNDVAEQMERQLSLARLHLELSDDLIQGYISLSAHHLNQIMKTLTIVTVIFVPITFMAGIYGMNFEYIPELGFRYGYFSLLGAMSTVIVGILMLFYWRGWLGGKS